MGISRVAIWFWEKGRTDPCGPSLKLIEYIERGDLKITPEELKRTPGRKKKVRRP